MSDQPSIYRLVADLKDDINRRFDSLEQSMKDHYVSKADHAEIKADHHGRIQQLERKVESVSNRAWAAILAVAAAGFGAFLNWFLKGGH
jgi:hypothetical protein